jgi:lysophospholipase L1-like esterase
MKCRFLLAVILSLAAFNGYASTINVFLVGGQSNADGRADSAELPENLRDQQDVLYYANSAGNKLIYLQPWINANREGIFQFGPEMTFGRSMADYYAVKNEKVALIKFAAGGTNLYENWLPDGTAGSTNDGKTYQNFQNAVKKALQAIKETYPNDTIHIRGMIWMQGEGDTDTRQNQATNGKYSLEYSQNLTDFIRDIRLTYGKDVYFVIGELSKNQTGTGPAIYRDNVRRCQEEIAKSDPLTGIINTDTCGLKSDNIHFNAAGQQAMGYAFAKEMQRLLESGR